MSKNFTFGSDPEFMIVDRQGNLKSAVSIIPSTSENRITIKNHTFYHDNVLAECGISPSSTRESTLKSFHECLKIYSEMVNPYKLIIQASASYPEEELNSLDARNMGCRPETCCYSGEDIYIEKAEEIIKKTGFRSAGGHIHIGVDNYLWKNPFTNHFAPKMFDLFLGIPSIFLDNDPTSAKRRAIYGHPGSFRRQSYGIEYRTLSNFWLASPKLVGLVWDISQFVVNFVNNKEYLKFWTVHQKAIDDYDYPDKWSTCHGYNINDLKSAIYSGSQEQAAPFMQFITPYVPQKILKTIEDLRKSKFDMYKEWEL